LKRAADFETAASSISVNWDISKIPTFARALQ
jgi:hypothetical protein